MLFGGRIGEIMTLREERVDATVCPNAFYIPKMLDVSPFVIQRPLPVPHLCNAGVQGNIMERKSAALKLAKPTPSTCM
jgi:hypothetical protein